MSVPSNKSWWVSWYQPTGDYRPVYDPKKESEPFGHNYWCSGQSETAWTMCAVVDATTEEEARQAVRRYWPEAVDIRNSRIMDRPRTADAQQALAWLRKMSKSKPSTTGASNESGTDTAAGPGPDADGSEVARHPEA